VGKAAIRIGMLGCGTVGTGVVELLIRHRDEFQRKAGARLELARIAVRDAKKARGLDVPAALFTEDPLAIVRDPAVDLVIEVMGGVNPAKRYVLEAIRSGKHVVTANKALLAECWDEVIGAARERGVEVYFEAAVGGGIPIIQSLSEGLAANRIQAIYGIVNGTSNYILTRMDRDRVPFPEALREAQAKGYAEADPSLDVGGGDAAHKLAILASLAFETTVPLSSVHVEGIQELTPDDFAYAREEFGYVVKLLAIAKMDEGRLEARVHPTLIPEGHALADVDGAYNGIYVIGDAVGAQMFYGLGAGRMPTASAVVGDLLYVARSIAYDVAGRSGWGPFGDIPNRPAPLPMRPIEDISSRFYLRLAAEDRPGVLAAIAKILGDHRVSIAAVVQKERGEGGKAPVVILTYEAVERDMQAARREIEALPAVGGRMLLVRVERGE
jgi:homoserine dehydrogenase